MPATTNSATTRTHVDRIIHEVEFSAINAGETFDYTFPSSLPALNPTFVRYMVTTLPSSRDPIFVAWTSDNTPGAANSGRTLELNIYTVPNGSVTNGVVRVYAEWLEQAAGGIS